LSLSVEADKLYIVVIAGINWYGDRVTKFNYSGVQVEELTPLVKYGSGGSMRANKHSSTTLKG